MITFKRITLENFLSFRNLEFDFQSGEHLVIGKNLTEENAESNGAGKSTIFEAIVWCLYGKTSRNDVSFNREGNCCVSLEFNINNDEYIIRRYHKHNNTRKIVLVVNGESVEKRLQKDVEEQIQSILNISYNLFTMTVVVLQGLPLNFSTQTPVARKGILEELLGFSILSKYQKIINKRTDEYKKRLNTVSVQYNEAKEQMIKLNTEISYRLNLQENLNIDDYYNEIIKLNEKLSILNEEILNCTNTDDNRYDEFIQKRIEANKKLNDLNYIYTHKSCPTCNRSYESDISYNDEKIDIDNIDKYMDKILENVAYYSTKIESIEETRLKYKQLKLKYNAINDEKQKLKEKIATLTNVNLEVTEEEKQNLEQVCDNVNIIFQEQQDIENDVDGLEYVNKMLQPSSHFRLKLVHSYLSQINYILEEICDFIFKDVKIELTFDKKETGIDISLTKNGKDFSYEDLSSGEKRRIDIVILLGLQKYMSEISNISTNLIVFDEIFDGLDQVGVENIIYLRKNLYPEDTCMYLISHQNNIKGLFQNVITVVKTDGESRIEE